ncbi:MAG TPA: hypothetical protein VKB34_21790 [Povalibacter sp.]|nr:hypothetical protein [Povalibacter sp.]
MNVLVAASLVAVAAAAATPVFVAGRSKPPQPFDEKVTLPGKVPPTAQSLSGSWQYGYSLADARLETGRGTLIVGNYLKLNAEDGTYELHYSANWNLSGLGSMPMPEPLPFPQSTATRDGLNVDEKGRFVLSGNVLLIEPSTTRRAEIRNNTVVSQHSIANEKHVLIVRLDNAHLAVAGRCASWQIDPVCKSAKNSWYVMNAQVGSRWLGREPQ